MQKIVACLTEKIVQDQIWLFQKIIDGTKQVKLDHEDGDLWANYSAGKRNVAGYCNSYIGTCLKMGDNGLYYLYMLEKHFMSYAMEGTGMYRAWCLAWMNEVNMVLNKRASELEGN